MLDYLILFFVLSFVYAEETPDYDKPYAPIFFDKPTYTWTDKVIITIVAPSWNTDSDLIDSIGNQNSHPINISTRGHSLDQYRFTETDVSSGVFTAEVVLTGFSHDADGDGNPDTFPRTLGNGPTSGFLETDRDTAITVSFEFADGVVLTESAPITWNKGIIQFSENTYLSDQTAIIRVIDLDMNLNPEMLDKIPVEVSSDSDSAGITVDAIETGESTGEFIANLIFTQNQSSSGNRLFVNMGDSISVKYEDYTLPKPYSTSEHLEVTASSKVESDVIPIHRIISKEVIMADSTGQKLDQYPSGTQLQIVGNLVNSQDFGQEFVYFIQIRDDQNSVVSLSWVKGVLSQQQSLVLSQSWTPKKSGQYLIDTFVWESINSQIALSPSIQQTFFIE